MSNWKQRTQERKQWKEIIEQAKTHRELQGWKKKNAYCRGSLLQTAGSLQFQKGKDICRSTCEYHRNYVTTSEPKTQHHKAITHHYTRLGDSPNNTPLSTPYLTSTTNNSLTSSSSPNRMLSTRFPHQNSVFITRISYPKLYGTGYFFTS